MVMTGSSELAAAWLTFASHLLATLVGGGLVILANALTDRRRRRAEEWDRAEHHRVVLTGIFSVRNFVFEHINRLEPKSGWEDLHPLQAALRQVNAIAEKARPENESLMMTLTDIQIRLDALVATVATSPRSKPLKNATARRQINDLIDAFEMFDVVSRGALSFSEEDLSEMAKRSSASNETNATWSVG